jgi:2-oxoglutarate dehydrogenase E2 component (dihydrolipoamide succinyltransferase)
MPQFGESVVEGTITKWLKSVGDPVQEFDPLVEVNTDKVDTEVASPASGVLLDILVQPGVVAHTGAVLAWIGAPGEQIPSNDSPTAATAPAATAPAATAPATTGVGQPLAASSQVEVVNGPPSAVSAQLPTASMPPPSPPDRPRDLGFISPVVARIAGEHSIDLFQVQGTGQGGRITKEDILNYIEAVKAAPPGSSRPSVVGGQPSAVPGSQPVVATFFPVTPPSLSDEILPLTHVRRAIAEHMVLSERTSPHVTTVMEVDLSRVVAHRQVNKAAFEHAGANLTYTAYFVAASAAALKEHPIVNSSWTEQGILLHRQVNIGMAASLGEEGLIVPVIKNAGDLSLLGLAKAINDLANRARAKKLSPDEVKGGTFTITNHGTGGSLFATPIINQPQCAILGVGMIQKRVVVVTDSNGSDALAIRPMVYLSLTFDHRILDGAIADAFLGKVVQSLQNWT